MITGQTLIDWGFKPGKWFGEAIKGANEMRARGCDDQGIYEWISDKLDDEVPTVDPRTNSIPFGLFLDPGTSEDEVENLNGVVRHMDALMRTPNIVAGAVMPDACPSGAALGTIPVGGVVSSTDIHPGFHSADVCCSMAITVFKRDMDVKTVLDLAMQITHFGGRGRPTPPELNDENWGLIEAFQHNPFLKGLEGTATGQMGSQGDGNHFFYVGHLASTGELAIVTHHGSRNVGGQLYKRGMAAARRHTGIVSPRTPAHNAWLKGDSKDGQDYWKALQLVREWTRQNHFWIHDRMQQVMGNKIVGRFWNEHNFVFQKSDGLFYHAKGATPNYDDAQKLIPLNMGQPILIVERNPVTVGEAMGFAPHGAGRNTSRTTHLRRLGTEFGADTRGISPRDQKVVIDRETQGIDVRFYCGTPDLSELPSAYKNPAQVRAGIEKYSLARIADEVMPAGSIMAGEAPWHRK